MTPMPQELQALPSRGVVKLGKCWDGLQYRFRDGILEYFNQGNWHRNNAINEFWVTMNSHLNKLGFQSLTGDFNKTQLRIGTPEPLHDTQLDLVCDYATLKHALVLIKTQLETDQDWEEIKRLAAEALEDIS